MENIKAVETSRTPEMPLKSILRPENGVLDCFLSSRLIETIHVANLSNRVILFSRFVVWLPHFMKATIHRLATPLGATGNLFNNSWISLHAFITFFSVL